MMLCSEVAMTNTEMESEARCKAMLNQLIAAVKKQTLEMEDLAVRMDEITVGLKAIVRPLGATVHASSPSVAALTATCAATEDYAVATATTRAEAALAPKLPIRCSTNCSDDDTTSQTFTLLPDAAPGSPSTVTLPNVVDAKVLDGGLNSEAWLNARPMLDAGGVIFTSTLVNNHPVLVAQLATLPVGAPLSDDPTPRKDRLVVVQVPTRPESCYPVLMEIEADDIMFDGYIQRLDIWPPDRGKRRKGKDAMAWLPPWLLPQTESRVSSALDMLAPMETLVNDRLLQDGSSSAYTAECISLALSTSSTTRVEAKKAPCQSLNCSMKVIEDRSYKNSVCSIILVSDGQDTYNVSSNVQRASADYRSLVPSSILNDALHMVPLHAFGFGADHDSDSLHSIAEASGGTFSFIEDEGVMQDAFAQCIGGLLSVVVQEMRLSMEYVHPGVQRRSIKSGSYQSKVARDGRNSSVDIGHLYADEERDILLSVNIPQSREKTSLLNVAGAYIDPVTNETIKIQGDEVKINRLTSTISEPVSIGVEFIWIGGQFLGVPLDKSIHICSQQSAIFSATNFLWWGSNIFWSLKKYENVEKGLVLWDVIAALQVFKKSAPTFLETLMHKWVSDLFSDDLQCVSVNIPYELHYDMMCKVSSRKLHLLNIICRKVMLSNHAEYSPGGEKGNSVSTDLWSNLLVSTERELQKRLVAFTFAAILNRIAYLLKGASIEKRWFPVGVAQMDSWVSMNNGEVHNQLKSLKVRIKDLGTRIDSGCEYSVEETCTYCSAPIHFQSPDVALCRGGDPATTPAERHKLSRCTASMRLCSILQPIWHCVGCGGMVDKLGPETFFTTTTSPLDSHCLYSCSEDNSTHCWIFGKKHLEEIPVHTNFPELKESTDLSEVSDRCFGLTLAPGELMTTMVLLWVFMGLFAGYSSFHLYKMLKGSEWKKNTLETTCMFPGIVFTIFFILYAIIWGEKSSGAVPFGTMFALVLLWFGNSVPLVFVGSYLGYKKEAIEDPVKINNIPRQIPGCFHDEAELDTVQQKRGGVLTSTLGQMRFPMCLQVAGLS